MCQIMSSRHNEHLYFSFFISEIICCYFSVFSSHKMSRNMTVTLAAPERGNTKCGLTAPPCGRRLIQLVVISFNVLNAEAQGEMWNIPAQTWTGLSGCELRMSCCGRRLQEVTLFVSELLLVMKKHLKFK